MSEFRNLAIPMNNRDYVKGHICFILLKAEVNGCIPEYFYKSNSNSQLRFQKISDLRDQHCWVGESKKASEQDNNRPPQAEQNQRLETGNL